MYFLWKQIFWSLIKCLTLAVKRWLITIMIYGEMERGVKVRPDVSVLHYTYMWGNQPEGRAHWCSQSTIHRSVWDPPWKWNEKRVERWVKKKLKKVQKTCEVSPIAVFWLICVTDNRFYVGWSMIISTKHIGFMKRSPFVRISKKLGASCKKVPPR